MSEQLPYVQNRYPLPFLIVNCGAFCGGLIAIPIWSFQKPDNQNFVILGIAALGCAFVIWRFVIAVKSVYEAKFSDSELIVKLITGKWVSIRLDSIRKIVVSSLDPADIYVTYQDREHSRKIVFNMRLTNFGNCIETILARAFSIDEINLGESPTVSNRNALGWKKIPDHNLINVAKIRAQENLVKGQIRI